MYNRGGGSMADNKRRLNLYLDEAAIEKVRLLARELGCANISRLFGAIASGAVFLMPAQPRLQAIQDDTGEGYVIMQVRREDMLELIKKTEQADKLKKE